MYEQFEKREPFALLDTSKYPPEVAGRFNSFITTQFDDSLSVEMQMRSIIKWAIDNFKEMDQTYNEFTDYILNGNINPFIEMLNDLIEYMNYFIGEIDNRLAENIGNILNGWLADGTLADIINEDVFDMKADKTFVDRLASREIWVEATGSADDSVAFQTAIDKAVGKVVRVPSGTFKVTNVVIPHDITIIGSENTIIKPIYRNGNIHFPETVFQAETLDHVTIENIQFHGDVSENAGSVSNIGAYTQPLLYFDNVKKVRIVNSEFKNISYRARTSTPTHFNDRRGMLTIFDSEQVDILDSVFSKIWMEETTWILPRNNSNKQIVNIINNLSHDYEPICYSTFGVIGGTINLLNNRFINGTNTNSPTNIFGEHVTVSGNLFENMESDYLVDTCEGRLLSNKMVTVNNNVVKNSYRSTFVQSNSEHLEIVHNNVEGRNLVWLENSPEPENVSNYHDMIYSNFRKMKLVNIEGNIMDQTGDIDEVSTTAHAIYTNNIASGHASTTGERIIEKMVVNDNVFIGSELRRNSNFTRINFIEDLKLINNTFKDVGISYGSSSARSYLYFHAIDRVVIEDNLFDTTIAKPDLFASASYEDLYGKSELLKIVGNHSTKEVSAHTFFYVDKLIVQENELFGEIETGAVNINRKSLQKPDIFRVLNAVEKGFYKKGDIIYKENISTGSPIGWVALNNGYAHSGERNNDVSYRSGMFKKYSDDYIYLVIKYGRTALTEPNLTNVTVGDTVLDGTALMVKMGTEVNLATIPFPTQ